MTRNEHEILIPLAPGAGGEPPTHVAVTVAYDKGGPNYFHGGTTARGYYVSASPLREYTVKAHADDVARGFKPEIKMRTFVLGRGYRALIETTARLNGKRLAAHVAEAHGQVRAREGKVWDLVLATLREGGLSLADPLTETAHAAVAATAAE